MAVNKVVYGTTTLVDLTGTTATAGTILAGSGAYGRDGVWMDGTVTFATIYTGSGEPAASLGQNGDIYIRTVS